MKAKRFVGVVHLALLLVGNFAYAQTDNHSYQYNAIDEQITVNKDSTIDVVERQTFQYNGTYHWGLRTIPLNKIGAVTDIEVVDGDTNQPLKYSSKQLDKTDPASIGKYTYFSQNGNQNIEWYYNLTDTTHTWILKYKVHGEIEFGKDENRLYWNIFTDYTVPVQSSQVTVTFPEAGLPAGEAGTFRPFAYRTYSVNPINQYASSDGRTFTFTSGLFAPQEKFTIDIGFPAAMIPQSAYWKDFFKTYWAGILAGIIPILALIIGFFIWLFREKLPKGRGVIIPQYEPPQHLRPAEAEVICKEMLTNKGLTATIIDLAVRGYVKIEEKQPEGFFSILFRQKDFVITPVKDFNQDGQLKEYEKMFLNSLFETKSPFSTLALQRDQSAGRELYQKIQKVKQRVYEATEIDTHAYEMGPSNKKYSQGIRVGIALAIALLFGFLLQQNNAPGQILFLFISAIVSVIGLWVYIKFAARLNQQGRILREDWLGFKRYLETAEKLRLQNLTPDMFEKFLPYAMIFGIEKKWAKAFENINIPPPNWYSGAAAGSFVGSSGNGTGMGGFSASAFSASFSSSFSSAFASSGAGGSGGGAGGGGAGGGGGGGGGGAG